MQYPKKLFRSDHYSIWLPYKLIDQNQDKDLFIPLYAIKNAAVKDTIASVQPKLSFVLVLFFY